MGHYHKSEQGNIKHFQAMHSMLNASIAPHRYIDTNVSVGCMQLLATTRNA